jgi:hypothetical protein
MALRPRWIVLVDVENMTTSLATEVARQGLVDRCTNGRTSRTTGCATEQAAEDGACNDP